MIINIGIHGAFGKMGIAIAKAISKQSDRFSVAGKFSRDNTDLLDFCMHCDVIIDFSVPDALENLLATAVKARKKLVIGTTGLSNEHLNAIKKAAESIAILYSPNMSVGANLVIEMAGWMAKILEGYDAEIIELHHKYKKDAPSGTALAIGRNIAASRGQPSKGQPSKGQPSKGQQFEDVAVFDRANKGERQDGDIGFSSLRAGGIWGEHEVIFANDSEVVTVSARALSREVFADGALFAANWLSSKDSGFYSMKDALSLSLTAKN